MSKRKVSRELLVREVSYVQEAERRLLSLLGLRVGRRRYIWLLHGGIRIRSCHLNGASMGCDLWLWFVLVACALNVSKALGFKELYS